MRRDYARILPVDGKKFVTKRRTWRATVSRYPTACTASDLLRLQINFEPEQPANGFRSLDLWVKDAPDVTLVAESIGMLEAINWWLEELKGDGDLFYDPATGCLLPHQE